jgi:UDP-N-acetylglucosamine acyltransferase
MNNIHPTAIVSPKATIGDNNTIGAYTIIHDNVYIGDNNFIDSHASIGSNGEIRDCEEFNGFVRIGDNNVIKEFVTIQIGENGITEVGDNCMLMSKSHLGHDAKLHNNVTLSTGVKVGGWVEILSYANVGLNSVIHQRLKIGRFVMIGMGSVVTKNIIDFSKISGNPCRLMGMNGYMIDKHELPVREISQEFILALDTVDNTYLTKWKER